MTYDDIFNFQFQFNYIIIRVAYVHIILQGLGGNFSEERKKTKEANKEN